MRGPYRLPLNSTLRKELGPRGTGFLEHALAGFERLLPHVDCESWKISRGANKSQGVPTSRATFEDGNRRALRLVLNIGKDDHLWTLRGRLARRRVPSGVGAIERTISKRERAIADALLKSTEELCRIVLAPAVTAHLDPRAAFDERVIATHLKATHQVELPLEEWFLALRQLAEQSYESSSLSFGCLIDCRDGAAPDPGAVFPGDYLPHKRFRALSDGYRTAYRVSGGGALLGFVEISGWKPRKGAFYPEWSRDMASRSVGDTLGLALTRQGDILVFENGQVTFSYRSGNWQYWNHAHILDLLRNAARVKHVPPQLVGTVMNSVYRAALDVAFRRSGGLFVVLSGAGRLRQIVRTGDAIEDARRSAMDTSFDQGLAPRKVQSMSRAVLVDLAALDGAVVLQSTGRVLAYGAVLSPRRRGRVTGSEGSRTKAAIGSSNYGVAVKVSSDGDVTAYVRGKELVRV